MHQCNHGHQDHHPHKNQCIHTNAFLELNGIPYLLAEYLDRNQFQQVDRSAIRSDLFVDQSECMRTIVDISVDDIGRRSSDCLPAIVGNTSKYRSLLNSISKNQDRLDHQLNVLRRGIIVRVNYRLETTKDRRVIRSMTEDLRITDRNYFIDINPRNVDDNAVIVNFCNSMVSTINNFTHGRDQMVLRITSVQLLYECVKPGALVPRVRQTLSRYTAPNELPCQMYDGLDVYRYHDEMQSHHVMGTPGGCDCYPQEECYEPAIPKTWCSFNRFYHFDNGGRDIILHNQEVNDPYCQVTLIPCGTVQINRAFLINPGSRIIFKFSIWKNDLIVVNDTTRVAQVLKAPMLDEGFNYPPPSNPADQHKIQKLISENRRQDKAIRELVKTVKELRDIVNENHPDEEDPDEPIIDVPPVEIDHCECDHSEINDKLDQVIKDVEDLKDNPGCDCEQILPISPDTIREMFE